MESNKSMFTNEKIILEIYINNLIILEVDLGNIKKVKRLLKEQFEIKNKREIRVVLSIKIQQLSDCCYISSQKYDIGNKMLRI